VPKRVSIQTPASGAADSQRCTAIVVNGGEHVKNRSSYISQYLVFLAITSLKNAILSALEKHCSIVISYGTATFIIRATFCCLERRCNENEYA
jgi:hypothetical protein